MLIIYGDQGKKKKKNLSAQTFKTDQTIKL